MANLRSETTGDRMGAFRIIRNCIFSCALTIHIMYGSETIRHGRLCAPSAQVMREGGLSGAARRLGLSQPTVGRHIDALEAALGVASVRALAARPDADRRRRATSPRTSRR